MRIFSRLVFICNICFIIAVILRILERSERANAVSEGLAAIQPLENSLIILGYGAIIINLIFVLIAISSTIFRRGLMIPAWITTFNIVLFICQVIYFFVLP